MTHAMANDRVLPAVRVTAATHRRFTRTGLGLLLLLAATCPQVSPSWAQGTMEAAPAASDAGPAAPSPGEGMAPATAESVPATTGEAASPPAQRAFGRQEALLASLTIFALAVFVGFEVITKVPPTLHTPLMSGSNAISGITLVGAILMAGSNSIWAAILGMLAVALAMINVVGGFLVTDRMLSMFRRK